VRSLLWIGDACVASGFARATHKTLDILQQSWDVFVLGLNYRGDPHPYTYPVYPAWVLGDGFGTNRLVPLVNELKPDCIVIQNDPWNIPEYMRVLHEAKIDLPVFGSIAVDGLNCNGRALNDLTGVVFWTEFAAREAKLGGYEGSYKVIPLGVDLDIYRPMNKRVIRREIIRLDKTAETFGFDEKSFVVLNVNRNQTRKRLDLTVRYFCEWLKATNYQDAFLAVHTCPTGEEDFDVANLMNYYGFADRLLLIQPEIGNGVDERTLAATYNLADVQVSTTMGEGFGLTTFEGMACGIPQIVPEFSALGELCKDAAVQIPCSTYMANRKGINTIGAIADEDPFLKALDKVYRSAELRGTLRTKGFQVVSQEKYRWDSIGNAFDRYLSTVVPYPKELAV
jgi:D-inositol-3-phosphate glycosyltransferase